MIYQHGDVMIAKHTTTVYQERRCGVINIYHGCRALTLALARLSCSVSHVRGWNSVTFRH